jgi:Arc/MetJ-type ribon-helix-helix transcriptional regulator
VVDLAMAQKLARRDDLEEMTARCGRADGYGLSARRAVGDDGQHDAGWPHPWSRDNEGARHCLTRWDHTRVAVCKRNSMLKGMSNAERVTVSLPAELLARIERRRHDRETSRSEVVSELLWRGWRQVEAEEREERYRAAYDAEPETDAERAWAEEAAEELFSGEGTGWNDTDKTAGAAS